VSPLIDIFWILACVVLFVLIFLLPRKIVKAELEQGPNDEVFPKQEEMF
jgi:hypothetical protein